jgi:hypothetical protein
VSEKSRGEQVKMPVGSMRKARRRLRDGSLASGLQNCACKQASWVYTCSC